MSKPRKIHQTKTNYLGYLAKVYYTPDLQEYCVKVFYYCRIKQKAEHQTRYDYFTDDKQDAINTAEQSVTEGR